ncbi:hypothetical protein ACIBCM_09290 [Streptomyces sp. NPDC051018]|uniref:hypothetical protein n=1 Tax=Streptomyces sp. NPDC051018 TaxID=3365639 RepID=UPI0037AB9384
MRRQYPGSCDAAFNRERTGSAREPTEQQESGIRGRAGCLRTAPAPDRLSTIPDQGNDTLAT